MYEDLTEVKLACRNWFFFLLWLFLSCLRKVCPNFCTQQATYLSLHLAESCTSSFDEAEDGSDYPLVHFAMEGMGSNQQDFGWFASACQSWYSQTWLCLYRNTSAFFHPHVPSGGLVGKISWKSHCLHGRDFSYSLELSSSSWWWLCGELVSGSWVRRLWNDSLFSRFRCRGQR